jgi:thiamine-monophosphate kinase
VVATTDMLLEGRHFRRDWSPPYDIGRKAAAQNLSDVAAMGARPTVLLVGLGAPPATPVSWVEALYDGLRDECALVGASVAGGDVVKSDEVVIAVTALGDLAGRAPVTRSGARPGDIVALNGRLGFAAAGMEALSRGDTEPADLIAAHRRPRPPYPAGPEAAVAGATAMLDVSDGLVQDLGHIAAASGVRIELFGAAIPLPPTHPEDALHLALTGGEDHALVATFPPMTALGESWRTIGRVAEGEGVVVDGKRYCHGGWDHFR